MRFEESYFVESSYSNYRDYRTKRFVDMTQDLITVLGTTCKDKILDFGCATGGLVNEFRKHGFSNIVGTDISYWAIDYGREAFGLDSSVLQHYNRQLLEDGFKYVLFTDVLEHVPTKELFLLLSKVKAEYLILRVPVCEFEGEDYVLDVHKNDKTHIQIHTKGWWDGLMKENRFGFDKVIHGNGIYETKGVLARVYSAALG